MESSRLEEEGDSAIARLKDLLCIAPAEGVAKPDNLESILRSIEARVPAGLGYEPAFELYLDVLGVGRQECSARGIANSLKGLRDVIKATGEYLHLPDKEKQWLENAYASFEGVLKEDPRREEFELHARKEENALAHFLHYARAEVLAAELKNEESDIKRWEKLCLAGYLAVRRAVVTEEEKLAAKVAEEKERAAKTSEEKPVAETSEENQKPML